MGDKLSEARMREIEAVVESLTDPELVQADRDDLIAEIRRLHVKLGETRGMVDALLEVADSTPCGCDMDDCPYDAPYHVYQRVQKARDWGE